MADRLQWKLTYGDKEYIFDPKKMLTVSALTQIKEWYGIEIGRYMTFQGALLQQDPQAALCALWLARKAVGEAVPERPDQMDDFRVGELFEKGFDTATPEADPTAGATPAAPTPDSTETPPSSEQEPSLPSDTSSPTDPEISTD
jgi:hypothetical protein